MGTLRTTHWQGKFFRRVFSRLAILLSVGMLVVAVLTWEIMQRWLHDYTTDQLINSAQVARLAMERLGMPADPPTLQAECREVRKATGLRMTMIDVNGNVIADSDADPSSMENHAARPEVAAALGGQVGRDKRLSASVGHPYAYVAVPIMRDGKVATIVRMAAPAEDLDRREGAIKALIGTGLAVALPVALLTAWFLARALAAPIQRVSAMAKQLSTGDLVTRVEAEAEDEVGQVAESLEKMRETLAKRVRQVQQQRKDLETTVSQLEEGVIAVDRDGVILLANASARRLLAAPDSAVSSLLADQLPRGPLQRAWHEALAENSPELRQEISIADPPTGAPRTIDISIMHVSEADSKIAWLICLRDITELARSVAMKTDFVANASHELRTPVAAIRAAVETLGENGLDEATRRRFMSMIERNVGRLQDLTEDLMHLNKVESPAVELTKTIFDPVEIFSNLRISFSDTLAAKNASFTYSSNVKQVFTDQRWLDLVLKNLVDNAAKFIGEGGRIELRCRADGAKVFFEVQDTGCGIGSEHLERVFERFYQVDKWRRQNAGGTGLGLAIVKHAVHAMRGEVSITSTVGVGTTVSFWIPADVPADSPSARPAPALAG